MASLQGWIKLHRQIVEHKFWQDKPFSRGQAWIDLLLMANHDDNKTMFDGRVLTVKRGTFITSLRKLSERWGWSIHKVSDFLIILEVEKMLLQKRDTKKTVLSIVKYNDYQDVDNTKGTQKGHRRDTEGTQKETNKNVKNDKNVKKNIPNGILSDFEKAVADFKAMRKAIKAPMTDRAIELLYINLDKICGGNEQIKIDVLNQSIANSWKGVFPLKPEWQGKNSKDDNRQAAYDEAGEIIRLMEGRE